MCWTSTSDELLNNDCKEVPSIITESQLYVSIMIYLKTRRKEINLLRGHISGQGVEPFLKSSQIFFSLIILPLKCVVSTNHYFKSTFLKNISPFLSSYHTYRSKKEAGWKSLIFRIIFSFYRMALLFFNGHLSFVALPSSLVFNWNKAIPLNPFSAGSW